MSVIMAHKIEVKPGHIVTVLKPHIDSISFTSQAHKVINVLLPKKINDWEAIPDKYWGKVFKQLQKLTNDKKCLDVQPTTNKSSKSSISVALSTEPSGPSFYLKVNKPGVLAPLRLEFNPNKVTLADIKQLPKLWAQFDGGLVPFEAFICDARITRVDIAIDLLNIRPRDLFVYNKKVWKIWSASSQDRGIETQNFYQTSGHKKSAQQSPKKRSQLMIYDKRKERVANGQEPIHGDLEHTRIEWSINKNLQFKNLPGMESPFDDWQIRRAIVSEPPLEDWVWTLLLDSARFRGFGAAWELIPKHLWPNDLEEKFACYLPDDLVTSDKLWKFWPEAISRANIDQFIKWAAIV